MEQPALGSDRNATTEPSDSASTNDDRFQPRPRIGTRSHTKGQGTSHRGESHEAHQTTVATQVSCTDDEHWAGGVRKESHGNMESRCGTTNR